MGCVDNRADEIRSSAFPTLTDDQIEFLRRYGEVRKGGEVLAIPPDNLKEIITEEPTLSDMILKAFLMRRSVLMRAGTGLRIVGSRRSTEALRLREFAVRNRLPHRWI